jgi:hypothetical protein
MFDRLVLLQAAYPEQDLALTIAAILEFLEAVWEEF